MATTPRTTPAPKAPITAITPAGWTEDEITAKLRELGYLETPGQGGGDISRVKVEGAQFMIGDEIFISNPKTKAPAFRCRILDVPEEYQAAYITAALAKELGRPEIADRFCKSHFAVEAEKREFAEDGTACRGCPINPFTKRDSLPIAADGRKCSWKADISFQLLDAEGAISDPTVHVLTLSTTGVIEFKGTGKEPTKGSVTDLNFMQRLARHGAESDQENPNRGLLKALTALRLGGVVADVRSIRAESDDKSRSWYVTSFEPVLVLDVDEAAPALPTGELVTEDAPASDLPF